MPAEKGSKPRKALGRDPFADLETLDLFDETLFGAVEGAIEGEHQSRPPEKPGKTAMLNAMGVDFDTLEDETAGLETDAPPAKPGKTGMLAAMGVDFDTLEDETAGLETDAPPAKPGKTGMLAAMGVDFDTLEDETAGLETNDSPAKPGKTGMLTAMGIDFDTLEDETASLDGFDEIDDERAKPLTISKPGKTAMLDAMGIDFDTLEDETVDLDEVDVPDELSEVPKPGKTAMLDAMGIDFDTLEDETTKVETGTDEIDTNELLADFDLNFDSLEEESAELDAAIAAQRKYEEELWAGMGMALESLDEGVPDESVDSTVFTPIRTIDLDVVGDEATQQDEPEPAYDGAPTRSLSAAVAEIDNEMRHAISEQLRDVTAADERQAKATRTSSYLLLSLAQLTCAIPIHNIVEIQRPLPITRVPNVPEWVLGISNLRGDIISVVDLSHFILEQKQGMSANGRFVVVRDSQKTITTTIVADKILEIKHLITDAIETSEQADAPANIAPYVAGRYQLYEREILLLDLDRLLLSSGFRRFDPLVKRSDTD